MPVGNCTEFDVEYDVVPDEGSARRTERFITIALIGGIIAFGGIAFSVSNFPPGLEVPFLLGGIAAVLGSTVFAARRLQKPVAKAAGRLAAAPLSKKRFLPAFTIDRAVGPFSPGQSVRFCQTQDQETIATVRFEETRAVLPEEEIKELFGRRAEAVILYYDDRGFQVKVLT